MIIVMFWLLSAVGCAVAASAYSRSKGRAGVLAAFVAGSLSLLASPLAGLIAVAVTASRRREPPALQPIPYWQAPPVGWPQQLPPSTPNGTTR